MPRYFCNEALSDLPLSKSMADSSSKKLQKSRSQRILFGVTGGIADYLDVDITLVRVAFVVLCLTNGVGFLVYIALAIFMPNAPELAGQAQQPSIQVQPARDERPSQRNRYFVGFILIAVGGLFLLQQFSVFWWLGWGTFGPAILILVGLALILGKLRR